MELSLLFPMTVSLVLHIARTGAFFAVVPLFGRQRDSFFLRLVLSLSLAAIFWSVGRKSVAVPGTLLELGVMTGREAVIGLALGFALAAVMSLLTIAGEIISYEMGFSMAHSINPESGANATVIAQLMQVLGMLLVFALDLHHDALRILEQTFAVCPIGEPFAIEPIWLGVRDLVAGAILLAGQLALPITGVMFLMSTGTVLIGRAIPSINMMDFAFALRVLMALGILGFFLVESAPFLIACIEGLFARTAGMFGG
jgi:flagellar biosynthetic protein FliR